MTTGDGMTTSKICGNHNIHSLFIDKKHVKFIAYLPLIALQNRSDAAVKFWCKDLVSRLKTNKVNCHFKIVMPVTTNCQLSFLIIINKIRFRKRYLDFPYQ